MSAYVYPASPSFVAEEKLSPSPSFKKQVGSVILSIILFFIVYLVLVIASVFLAIFCCYGGVLVILSLASFLGLLVGLGLIAVGLSVIFFLIKFIFAVSKNDNAQRIEITEAEQPRLFEFIRQLTTETKTKFPKKIFLSPDVNACVFYNSSFWSMFLPLRKNLEIGLGLINSINISEFKAVMAHEFGHFSQRSMKLGSFTYNVNRIIYNMLYENNSYSNFLNAWGNLHGILGICAMITVKIAQFIQWILRGMYSFLNKSYMGLSREMEFHADAIAASVAGGNNVVNGLARIELAQVSYNSALRKADELLKENKISANIFSNQLTVFQKIATEHRLAVKDGLPVVSTSFLESFSKSRINYKDQWMSHPSLEDRRINLERLDINIPADDTSAWSIFDNAKELQHKLTEHIYKSVEVEAPTQFTEAEFEALQQEEKEQYSLPKIYNGYYDKRFFDLKEWDFTAIQQQGTSRNFEALFTEEHIQLPVSIAQNKTDIETLKAIRDKQISTKTFDFDGSKYSRRDAASVIALLEEDTKQNELKLEQLDKEIFAYYSSSPSAEKLKEGYEEFNRISGRLDAFVAEANKLFDQLAPLYQQVSRETAEQLIADLKRNNEPAIKKIFNEALNEKVVKPERKIKLYENIIGFLNKDYQYFAGDTFFNNELNDLTSLVREVAGCWDEFKFSAYKQLLEVQAKSR